MLADDTKVGGGGVVNSESEFRDHLQRILFRTTGAVATLSPWKHRMIASLTTGQQKPGTKKRNGRIRAVGKDAAKNTAVNAFLNSMKKQPFFNHATLKVGKFERIATRFCAM